MEMDSLNVENNMGSVLPTLQRSKSLITSQPELLIVGAETDGNEKELNKFKDHKISNLQALANLLRANIGIIGLTLPFALKQAGLIVGTIGILFCGALHGYSSNLLVRACEKVSKENNEIHGMAELAFLAFKRSKCKTLEGLAKIFKIMINFTILLTLIGSISINIIFVGRMAKELTDLYFSEYIPESTSLVHFITGTTVILLPYAMVKSLKVLSFFSFFANLTTAFCFVIIMQYLLRHIQPIENLKLTCDFHGFFMFLGTAILAHFSAVIILPLKASMKMPEDLAGFDGVLSLGTTIPMCFNTALGFFGYLAFGEEALIIPSNLPPTLPYQIIKFLYAICIFLYMGLNIYVIHSIIWPLLASTFNRSNRTIKTLLNYFHRLAIVTVCYSIAALVPCLEQLLSLVGSMSHATLSFVYPAIIDIAVSHFFPEQTNEQVKKLTERQEKTRKFSNHLRLVFITIVDILIITVALVTAFAGTYTAFNDILLLISRPGGCG